MHMECQNRLKLRQLSQLKICNGFMMTHTLNQLERVILMTPTRKTA
jgi:hypothetical protein